jgi:hypothetical protein
MQIWDKTAENLLHVWLFPSNDVSPSDSLAAGVDVRHRLFARGAAINIAEDGTANLCFGDSAGTLHVLNVSCQYHYL